MITQEMINESKTIVDDIISNEIVADNKTKERIHDLLTNYEGNKWAALLVVAPFLDGSKEPLREATKSMLLFDHESKNKDSAFSRKVEPLESSNDRMKWFYDLKESSPVSYMVDYALQEVEMAIRERKGINKKESYKKQSVLYSKYKANLDRAKIGGYENEAKIVEKIYSLQTPTRSFWII